MTTCASAVQRRAYRRHRPEQTVLHALVREHLPAFLRHADEDYVRPLAPYVRRAFEQYLRCGLPEHGFLRVRCNDCGHDRSMSLPRAL
ncbi:MAG: transposase zinc-binding domain-containing protein [Deltaproteobacteria bacterium]|nr:transposase zinc-binding domain-containing protein [Deltaproteobacteria bacterium]